MLQPRGQFCLKFRTRDLGFVLQSRRHHIQEHSRAGRGLDGWAAWDIQGRVIYRLGIGQVHIHAFNEAAEPAGYVELR